jgi:hypothetical protein
MTTDLHFYGAALDVGRGLVQRASDPLVERFLDRMASPDAATAATDADGDAVDLWRSATDLLGSFTGRRRRRS